MMKTVDDRTPRTDTKLSQLTSTEVSPSAKRAGGYQSVKHLVKKSDPKELSAKVPLELLKGVHGQPSSNTQKLRQKLALISRSGPAANASLNKTHLPTKALKNTNSSHDTHNSSLQVRVPYSQNNGIVKPSSSMIVLDGSSQAGNNERKAQNAHTMDPSMRNEQRRMLQLLNGVKQSKNAGFVEQLRDEQRQIRQSTQQLYGPYSQSKAELADRPVEYMEHRWEGHKELLPSNGGPTMHKSEIWEDDDDGNISQNPYYAGVSGLSGDQSAMNMSKYAKMLRK